MFPQHYHIYLANAEFEAFHCLFLIVRLIGSVHDVYRGRVEVLGRVVRKPVNPNPGLKVNRGNNFSCIKVLSIAYFLRSLKLLMLKNEGQKI